VRKVRRNNGFTLIEVMVVLAILGLIMTLGASGFRRLTKSDLRSSSAHLAGAVRYLFDRASTTGKVHRLVLDLGDGKYWAEVSDDRFYVPHEAESEEELRRREEKEADQDEEQRKLAERKAKEEEASSSSSSYDASKMEIGDFAPKRARFAAFKELALKPVSLKNAKLRSVYTPRTVDALTTGRAYIYFFPLGQTEAAILTLSDVNETAFYSLVVHPITGRVKVYNEEIYPPSSRSQVDDEGKQVVE
jgi:general secretion pathway protein H